MTGTILLIFFAAMSSISLLYGQQEPGRLLAAVSVTVTAAQTPPSESRRIFGIIPNNRTLPSLTNYQPISAKEKFEIARQDSFDRGTVILAAIFAADSQFSDANPAFGQGVRGYSRYFGTAYADRASNVLKEFWPDVSRRFSKTHSRQ